MDDSKVLIHSKDGMTLHKGRDEDVCQFWLEFDVSNPKYDLRQILGLKMYDLMASVNKDIIENLSYVQPPTTDMDNFTACILFSRFGAELGIAQKYMCTKVDIVWDSPQDLRYYMEQIDKPNSFDMGKAESVVNSRGVIHIYFSDHHNAHVVYEFGMNLDEDIPPYMKKLPGLLMSKIFTRVKTFVEAM